MATDRRCAVFCRRTVSNSARNCRATRCPNTIRTICTEAVHEVQDVRSHQANLSLILICENIWRKIAPNRPSTPEPYVQGFRLGSVQRKKKRNQFSGISICDRIHYSPHWRHRGMYRVSFSCAVKCNALNGYFIRKELCEFAYRNKWPTCEQGAISTRPPHCHTRNDISRFSPPQIFICGSYAPISKKYSLLMANRPPAIAGVGNGRDESFERRLSSMSFMRYHRKCICQLNAPQCNSKLLMYWKLSSDSISITGHTTFLRSSFTRANNGSSHPIEHSQCASRNVKTSPAACSAPNKRAVMSPSRLCIRSTFVWTGNWAT